MIHKSGAQTSRPATTKQRRRMKKLSNTLDSLMDPLTLFRLHREEARRKPQTSPTLYMPKVEYIKPKQRSVSFSKSSRFNSREGFMGTHYQTSALCTESPGPIYNPPVEHRNTAHSWGSIKENKERQMREKLIQDHAFRHGGPASYCPSSDNHNPIIHNITFSKEKRFNMTHDNSPGPIYNPAYDTPGPKYTFAAKRSNKNTKSMYSKDTRTSFVTHSIRGGLAISATTEAKIGPATYSPDNDKILKNNPVIVFSKTKRFEKENLRFISKEHCKNMFGIESPGPSHYDVHPMPKHRVSRSSWVRWIP